jgi:hypothetical protein
LGYLDKTKKKQQLAKKCLMQKAAEKSRRTLDPTIGYGSLDEHYSDDEEEEIIQNRRVKRKGKKGKMLSNHCLSTICSTPGRPFTTKTSHTSTRTPRFRPHS